MATQALQRNWARINGLNIHFLSAGEGETVLLLLHGGSSDSALLSWSAAIPDFAEYFRVIAPDFPGFGQSEKPRIPYTADYLTDFVEAFLQQQSIKQACVVGLSMGGLIALKLGLQKPNRLVALILVDSVGLGSRFPYDRLVYPLIRLPISAALRGVAKRSRKIVRAALSRIVFDSRCLNDEVIEQVYQEVCLPGAGYAWGSFLRHELCWTGFRQNLADRLGEIETPLLIIHGKEDRLVPVQHALRVKHRWPQVRVEILDNCGHWPPRERPATFNRIVLEFLLDAGRFHSS